MLFEESSTAPNGQGVLVIDEHGDRKKGQKTAHIGRQYLANLGKTDNGVVSVTSLWADEDVYYPLDFEPYTLADYFAEGKQDPAFRTKLRIALELVQRAIQAHISFRAAVADNFYGEDCEIQAGLARAEQGLRVGTQALACLVASQRRDQLIPAGGEGSGMAVCRAPGALAQGYADMA